MSNTPRSRLRRFPACLAFDGFTFDISCGTETHSNPNALSAARRLLFGIYNAACARIGKLSAAAAWVSVAQRTISF
jgi:hypothetical protein